MDTCKAVSPKLSNHFSQLYIMYRSYLIPLRLGQYKIVQGTTHPMCSPDVGTIYHLLWKCPVIQGFWSQIIKFPYDTIGYPVTLHPKQCLLGIFLNPDLDKFTKVFLLETLFSARKVIARQWMRTTPPKFTTWMLKINDTLPFLYTDRGCPSKYYKIWDCWLQAFEMCV